MRPAGLPLRCFQPSNASGSMVISAPTNGLGVADDHRLADQRVRSQLVLQDGGGDVLASRGDDDFLLAADDRQEPVVVDRAEVTGVEPTVDDAPSSVACSLCQ